MFDKLKGRFDGQEGLHGSSDSKDHRLSRSSSSGKQGEPAPPPFAAQEYKAPPPEKPAPSHPFSTNFASVSLHMGDRIRLLDLPIEQRDAIRDSITRTWPRGIQREREYYGSHEFKMSGNPWMPSGDEALYARRLTRGILATLSAAGWILYVSTDISRNQGDKDNLFFRHQMPAPAPREWFSVTFSRGDRIRLIDAPREVVDDVLVALRPETQRHEPYRLPGVYEIKLTGWPFAASGGSTMVSRRLCLKLFSVFENHGYTLSASMDQKYDSGHGEETDSWHVSRPVDWQKGAPVYHE